MKMELQIVNLKKQVNELISQGKSDADILSNVVGKKPTIMRYIREARKNPSSQGAPFQSKMIKHNRKKSQP
jgi:hypothetical protein